MKSIVVFVLSILLLSCHTSYKKESTKPNTEEVVIKKQTKPDWKLPEDLFKEFQQKLAKHSQMHYAAFGDLDNRITFWANEPTDRYGRKGAMLKNESGLDLVILTDTSVKEAWDYNPDQNYVIYFAKKENEDANPIMTYAEFDRTGELLKFKRFRYSSVAYSYGPGDDEYIVKSPNELPSEGAFVELVWTVVNKMNVDIQKKYTQEQKQILREEGVPL